MKNPTAKQTAANNAYVTDMVATMQRVRAEQVIAATPIHAMQTGGNAIPMVDSAFARAYAARIATR